MLKRIKIQGYKSLVDVEVHLQPLTVLFGPNASGKSNFLDALQLLSRIANSHTLREAFAPPYRGLPVESFTFDSKGIQGIVEQERVSFSFEADVELSQTVVESVNQKIRSSRNIKTVAEGKKVDSGSQITYVHERNLSYRIEIEMFPKAGMLRIANEALTLLNTGGEKPGGILSENFSDVSFLSQPPYGYQPMLPYIDAMRQELANWFFHYFEPHTQMRIPTPIKEARHIGLMGEDLNAFFNTLRVLDEKQFKALEKALHVMIPSVTSIDVHINNRGEIELNLKEGDKPVSTRLLSDGTIRILGLLTLGGAKESPSLIGLEEPENGIYPDRMDLIALLLESRATSGIQMIVTTHSPVLLDLIARESLFVCRKRNGRTEITPLSALGLPDKDDSQNGEIDFDIPELTIAERIIRGYFDAEN